MSDRKKYDAGKFEAFPDEQRTAELSWSFAIEMQIAGTVLHKTLSKCSNIQILIILKCSLPEVRKEEEEEESWCF